MDVPAWAEDELRWRSSLAVTMLRALANPVRLQIVYQLLNGERSVGELARLTGVTYPAVSQHLRRLREATVVESRHDGTSVYYGLLDNHVAGLAIEALWYAGHVRPADTSSPPAES